MRQLISKYGLSLTNALAVSLILFYFTSDRHYRLPRLVDAVNVEDLASMFQLVPMLIVVGFSLYSNILIRFASDKVVSGCKILIVTATAYAFLLFLNNELFSFNSKDYEGEILYVKRYFGNLNVAEYAYRSFAFILKLNLDRAYQVFLIFLLLSTHIIFRERPDGAYSYCISHIMFMSVVFLLIYTYTMISSRSVL